jgi:hypothetical protein
MHRRIRTVKIIRETVCRLTDRGLAIVARRCRSLQQLHLQFCPEITNGGLLGRAATEIGGRERGSDLKGRWQEINKHLFVNKATVTCTCNSDKTIQYESVT